MTDDSPILLDRALRPVAAALLNGGSAGCVLRSGPGEGRSTALRALSQLLADADDRLRVVTLRWPPNAKTTPELRSVLDGRLRGEQGVLLVDDVQYADEASAAELARLGANPRPALAGMVLTSPSGVVLPGALDMFPSVELAGLDDDQLRVVLGPRATVAPDPVVRQIRTLCRRNPLVLGEVAALLTPDQLSGRAPLPPRPPLGPESRRVLARSVPALPRPTRDLLLHLALADGDLTLALSASGAGLDALSPAEHAGLVQVHAGRCRWNPPLLCDAVLQRTATADLVRASRALESAGRDTAGTLRRALLAVTTAVGPASPDLHDAVVTLAAAGRLAEAYEAAVAAIPRAPEAALRARFRTSSAELAWLGGYPDHAMDLLTRREPDEPEDESAHVLRWAVDGTRTEWPEFVAAVVEEPSLAARLTGTALVAGWDTVPPGQLAELALGLRRLERRTPAAGAAGVTALARVATGCSQLSAEEQDALQALAWWVQPADALHPKFWPPPLLPIFLGAEVRYERQFSSLLATPFARSAAISRSILLEKRAYLRWATGRWSEALHDALAGAELARRAGQPALRERLQQAAALVHASRGDEPGCVQARGPDLAWLAELSAGKPDAALDGLAELHRGLPPSPHDLVLRRLSTVDLVTAAVRCQRADLVASVVTEFETWVEAGAAPWARMDLARCRAMLAGADAGRWYEQALGLAAEVGRPAATARTQLEYGAWLRRGKHKREARVQLRAAEVAFTALGATEWARRAEAGLRATGEAAPHVVGDGTLTAQERRIAELAAQGLNNKQIAGELALSHRTVGYHLHKVFTKMRITSRAQLARTLDALP
jgi:DNA-binding CsgD family transcriptional regulator